MLSASVLKDLRSLSRSDLMRVLGALHKVVSIRSIHSSCELEAAEKKLNKLDITDECKTFVRAMLADLRVCVEQFRQWIRNVTSQIISLVRDSSVKKVLSNHIVCHFTIEQRRAIQIII